MQPTDATLGDEEELDLRAYLAVLGRRWKLIAVVTVLVVAAALGFSLQQTPQYRAESELLISQNRAQAVVSDGGVVGNPTQAARELNNEVRLFESGQMVAAVREAYDGPLDPGDVDASVASDTSDIMEASVTAADPDDAAALVNTYVEVFIDVRRQQRVDEILAVGEEIQAKIDELQPRITEIRAPLDALDARIAADPTNEALLEQRDALAENLAPQLAPLESQRAFYQSQLEELELTADIAQTGGVRILSTAEPPSSPVSPQPLRNAVLALVVGGVLGVGAAFLKDTLDERIRSVGDLERVTGGLPTLALVPEVEKHDSGFVATRDDPRSPQAEAYRSLRTAVKFAGLDRPLKVVQVTSPATGEGKTTAIANLAVALAQGGDRVAVVCCDLRRPRVQERFGVSLAPGFTDVLVGDTPLAEALRRYEPNLLILPAGSPPPNPSELLSSGRAEAVIRALSEEFDLVLLDSTPVLPVTDSLVVSRLVDATVLVADSRSTSRKAVARSLQLLGQVNAPVMGVVLNGLPEGGRYGYGYGYAYGYTYADTTKPRRWLRDRGAEPEPATKR